MYRYLMKGQALPVLLLLICFHCSPSAAAVSPDVCGDWVPAAGDSLIRIECDATVTVTLVALRGGDPVRDTENPSAALRGRLLAGLTLGEGFTFDGEAWTGGKLYDPGSGNTYNARLRLRDADRLEVRGYVGLPAFGRTEVWTRKSEFAREVAAMLEAGGDR